MTEREKTQIISMWESRLTIEQMIRLIPKPRRVAEKMIADLRADGSLKARSRREMLVDKLSAEYISGTTDIYELSKMFDIRPNTVTKYLTEAGFKKGREPKNFKRRELNAKAKEILGEFIKDELTDSEIARKFGVSRQYVYQLKQRIKECI